MKLFDSRPFAPILAACMLTVGVHAAVAQAPAFDADRAAALGSRNQLGLLEFCRASGFVTADQAAKMRKYMLDDLAGLPDPTGAAETEELGKKGLIDGSGGDPRFFKPISMEQDARERHTTVAARCQRMVNPPSD